MLQPPTGIPYLAQMQTWVLVIVMLANSQPVGVTSVPGYTSVEACLAAGAEFKRKEHSVSATPARREADYDCITGPSR